MNKLLYTLAAVALFAGAMHLFTAGPGMGNLQAAQTAVSEHIANEFAEWKKLYNIKYNSNDYEYYRMRIFEENYMLIALHNADPVQSYTMAPNQFMDLTQEEFIQTYLTLQVPNGLDVVESSQPVEVNAAINWVAAGKVSPVKNQGSCGSCWAFSAVAALESLERINGQGTTSFSEQQLVDCSRSFGNQGCNGGWMDNAFQYVQKHGITDTASYPYNARDNACKTQGGSYHIKGYTAAGKPGNCNEVIGSLGGRPISVAVDATNWSFYAGGVFRNCAANLNHGVLLVGVDNAGNWNVKNSWGGAWGNSGYITLAPGNTCGLCNAASYAQ